MIISLLYMQKKTFTSFNENADMFDNMIKRIKSIADVHDIMSMEQYQDQMINVDTIIKKVKNHYLGMEVEISYEGDDLYVLGKIATFFALIVNEIINNCLKHAFKETEGEKIIEIVIKKIKDDVVIDICDNGCGLPDSFDIDSNKSLGTRIIKMIAEDQLQGELKYFRSDYGGTEVRITIPMSQGFTLMLC